MVLYTPESDVAAADEELAVYVEEAVACIVAVSLLSVEDGDEVLF